MVKIFKTETKMDVKKKAKEIFLKNSDIPEQFNITELLRKSEYLVDGKFIQ